MIFATLIIGVLCGMGLGSGGLFVVYLTVVAGYEQLAAQGLNLYFFIFSTAAALLIHIKKQPLPLSRLLYICTIGSIGCAGGAMLAQGIDRSILRIIFALLLIVSGTVSLFSNKKAKNLLR
ncbi:MAG: sulfite exporter TauE/SafE family protein [Clostridia bacterium]|nr:sulfite exporter TauE/SafE family protein [Clostridia bacterium]